MEQLGLSNSAHRSDEYYREQWSSYYAERRRLLNRVICLAFGLGIFFLLFIAVAARHPGARYLLTVPGLILLLALPAQWSLFNWRIVGWTCPRCGEYFFASTFVQNPFGRKCRHCGIVRPRESEVDHYHFEDDTSRPQSPDV